MRRVTDFLRKSDIYPTSLMSKGKLVVRVYLVNYGLLCHLCIKWTVTEGVLRTENTRVFSTLVFSRDAGRQSAFTVLQGTSLAALGVYFLKSISWERASVYLKKWELLRKTILILMHDKSRASAKPTEKPQYFNFIYNLCAENFPWHTEQFQLCILTIQHFQMV